MEICAKELDYPVITKPVDSNGSSGFSVCRNTEEFLKGYEKAKENESRKNEPFISFNDKLISHAKSKEQDDYTIEIDAIKENDIKTNIKEKSISNNYI